LAGQRFSSLGFFLDAAYYYCLSKIPGYGKKRSRTSRLLFFVVVIFFFFLSPNTGHS
jgi:hypothetical protein